MWGELFRIGLEGKYSDSTLSMSGITLNLVSDVALHLVNRWVMSSVGVGGWESITDRDGMLYYPHIGKPGRGSLQPIS